MFSENNIQNIYKDIENKTKFNFDSNHEIWTTTQKSYFLFTEM